MTYTPGFWTCDGCGERVDEREVITLATNAGSKIHPDDYEAGWLAHYHLECWLDVCDEVHDVAVAVDEEADEFQRDVLADLEALPVTQGPLNVPPAARREPLRGAELLQKIREANSACSAPGGLDHLPRWLDDEARARLRQADLYRIADIDRMTDEQLLSVHGIGPKRLRSIREAIASWKGPSPGRRDAEAAS